MSWGEHDLDMEYQDGRRDYSIASAFELRSELLAARFNDPADQNFANDISNLIYDRARKGIVTSLSRKQLGKIKGTLKRAISNNKPLEPVAVEERVWQPSGSGEKSLTIQVSGDKLNVLFQLAQALSEMSLSTYDKTILSRTLASLAVGMQAGSTGLGGWQINHLYELADRVASV